MSSIESRAMHTFHLRVERAGGAEQIAVSDPTVVVAGFTGRDVAAVEAHIEELRGHGIAPPPATPVYYTVPSWLLCVGPTTVPVSSGKTSGEAEPVLVRLPSGELFVGIGSDHTDREMERASIEASKLACPKLLGPCVWPLEEVEGHWDELLMLSYSGDDDGMYQRASLAELRPPRDVLAGAADGVPADRPLVLFLGTVSLLTDFRYENAFRAVLHDESGGRELQCSYAVKDLSAIGAP